jgi:hypothetical protein
MTFYAKNNISVKAVFWTFRKLDLLPPSGKKRKDRNPRCCPLVELASDLDRKYISIKFTTFRKLDLLPSGLRLAQPWGPAARISVLTFYLKMEEDPASET